MVNILCLIVKNWRIVSVIVEAIDTRKHTGQWNAPFRRLSMHKNKGTLQS